MTSPPRALVLVAGAFTLYRLPGRLTYNLPGLQLIEVIAGKTCTTSVAIKSRPFARCFRRSLGKITRDKHLTL